MMQLCSTVFFALLSLSAESFVVIGGNRSEATIISSPRGQIQKQEELTPSTRWSDDLPLFQQIPVNLTEVLNVPTSAHGSPMVEPVNTGADERGVIRVRDGDRNTTKNTRKQTTGRHKLKYRKPRRRNPPVLGQEPTKDPKQKPQPALIPPEKVTPKPAANPASNPTPKLAPKRKRRPKQRRTPFPELTEEQISQYLVESLDSEHSPIWYKEVVDGETEASKEEERLVDESPLNLKLHELEESDLVTISVEDHEDTDPGINVVQSDTLEEENNLSLPNREEESTSTVSVPVTTTVAPVVIEDSQDLNIGPEIAYNSSVKSSLILTNDETSVDLASENTLNATIADGTSNKTSEHGSVSTTAPGHREEYAVVLNSKLANSSYDGKKPKKIFLSWKGEFYPKYWEPASNSTRISFFRWFIKSSNKTGVTVINPHYVKARANRTRNSDIQTAPDASSSGNPHLEDSPNKPCGIKPHKNHHYENLATSHLLLWKWRMFEHASILFLPRETSTIEALARTVGVTRTFMKRFSIPHRSLDADYFRKVGLFSRWYSPSMPDLIIGFHLFTRNNRLKPYFLGVTGNSAWDTALFRSDRKTRLICHDFKQGPNEPWVTELKDSLLNEEDINVIVVDWKEAASTDYWIATANVRPVARKISCFLKNLGRLKNMPLRNVHIIGFGLGAHVAGYTGINVIHCMCQKLGRITGLDVSAPLFEEFGQTVNSEQAEFVDLIHTSSDPVLGLRGQVTPTGHVDFYTECWPTQPNCADWNSGSLQSSSHTLSHVLFTESVRKECVLSSTSCSPTSILEAHNCTGCGPLGCGVLGLHSPEASGRGVQHVSPEERNHRCVPGAPIK